MCKIHVIYKRKIVLSFFIFKYVDILALSMINVLFYLISLNLVPKILTYKNTEYFKKKIKDALILH